MQNMPERWPNLQEALREAEEELFLLRCVLQCLMAAGEGQELTSLWRLSDYLRQHIGDIRRLCR